MVCHALSSAVNDLLVDSHDHDSEVWTDTFSHGFLVKNRYRISVRKKEAKRHLTDECVTGRLYRNEGGYVV
jgi:hypothetical protein